MKRMITVLSLVALMFGFTQTPVDAGWDPGKSSKLKKQVETTVTELKLSDPGLKRFFKEAYGYAVFPTVGKGGFGIGGAYGKGLVYEKNKLVGSTTLKQLSIGFQWGGQAYSEIIFFKNKAALNDFKFGNYEFGAAVSAVALTAGASADADYSGGVAIFTQAKGGLMYEASVGGQKFTYTPNN